MKMPLQRWAAALGLIASLVGATGASAHESITAEARKTYLAKLAEAQQGQAAQAAASVRARSAYVLGSTLDEIRDLFNQDIISHGAVKGLESNVLLNELARAGFKLEMSTRIGLYLSPLHYYREAIKLDARASYADHAKYLLLKNHFYDSFTDNPLAPFSQTKEELAELLAIGESLVKVQDPAISAEEVRFILAIHYLQAVNQKLVSKEEGQKRFAKLLADLRKDFPKSLKPMTLEALNP
jgi:hypothetical protein